MNAILQMFRLHVTPDIMRWKMTVLALSALLVHIVQLRLNLRPPVHLALIQLPWVLLPHQLAPHVKPAIIVPPTQITRYVQLELIAQVEALHPRTVLQENILQQLVRVCPQLVLIAQQVPTAQVCLVLQLVALQEHIQLMHFK